MPPRRHLNILTIALALKEPTAQDWSPGSSTVTGTNLRTTEDTALVARLRAQRLAEVLQAPARGRQPISGRPKYIIRLYPNADAPALSNNARVRTLKPPSSPFKRIPLHLLASITQAVTTEWSKQRANFSRNLEQEISNLEAQLLSTKDRAEKKRLADALQTTLHSDENMDGAIAKRVYAKLANSGEIYSEYVDAIDWAPQPQR